jgi:predicted peptidase
MRLLVAILGFIVLSACGNNGHIYSEVDYPSRTVTVNGVEYRYRVFVPKDRIEGQKLPVMLYLHGSNRRGSDNQAQLADIEENIRGFPGNWQFIVVAPQCREDTFWAGPMMDQAVAALDQTVREFSGDENRLYLAGYSMGGFGVWQTAITYPEKFAALVPVAGGVEPNGDVSDEDRALLSPQVTAAASAADTYRAYAVALKSIPIWIVHGEKDEAVPVDGARKMAEALRTAGDQNVTYRELQGVGHGSVVQAFSDPKLFEWLAKQNLKFDR